MFTPTLKGYPKIVNAHGELNATWENLRNGYKKAKLFRLIEFEALGDVKFTKEQKYHKTGNTEAPPPPPPPPRTTFVSSSDDVVGESDPEWSTTTTTTTTTASEDNYNKHKLSHLGGHYVIMVVPYKVLTIRTTPAVVSTAGITVKCQVGIGHTKGINIPEAGTCVIKGVIPFVVPYVRYTAVVEFFAETTHGASISTSSKGTHGKDNMVQYGFKIVQLVGCDVNPKETMRVLDLASILRDESVKMSHLFDSFLDESRDRLGQQQRFYKMGDLWSLSYLDLGGVNYKAFVSKLPNSKWGRLSKRALILKVYPNLTHYILEQFTEGELNALQKKLADRTQNWFFALFPFELVKLFPLRFIKLITDNYGNCYKVSPFLLNKGGDITYDPTQLELWEAEQKKCYDWMLCMKDQPVNQKLLAYMTPAKGALILSPLKLQFIEFYNTEIVDRMISTNSTTCILSRDSLSKEIHSKKYDVLFNPTSGLGLDKILTSLVTAGRLVKLDNATFNNLRDQYIPGLSSNTTTVEVELLLRRLFLECIPNSCYTLVEMWTISQKIIARLFDLRENMVEACLKTSFNHEEFHSQQTGDNCYRFLVDRPPSSETEGSEEGEPLEVILTREQTDAIFATTSNAVVCVIGMPGTGKTLFIEALCRLYNHYQEEEDGEGVKLIIRVAVVTHGGCMANELKKRGIPGAQNIHMALKKRYLPVSPPNNDKKGGEEAFETLDYSAIEILVVDEFSNVSDELAASLYSKEVFPNLRCMVHVFDPIQNQPIGNGALSIDYMQSFPTVAISTTPQRVQQQSDTLGVTLALKKCHRFDTEGLIGINDAIVTKNCKIPFVFDGESFMQYECNNLPPLKTIDALQKLLKSNQNVVKLRSDLTKYLPKGRYTLWDVLSGSHEKTVDFYAFGTQSQDRDSNYSQLLALTNEICGTINTLCDFLHTLTYFEGLDKLVREEILDLESSQSTRRAEEEGGTTKVDLLLAPPLKVSFALCRGARVLMRDFRPSQRVHVDINHRPEQIRPLFEECCSRGARYLPSILLPKLSKNVTENTQAEISENHYKEIIGAIEDVFADYDFLRQMYGELQAIADQYMNIFSSPLFNGTTFTFLGVVDLKIDKVTASDIISRLKEEETILVSEVTTMLAENKGKGSKARKEEIFREGKDIHKQIYSPQNIYQKLLDLEGNRWRLPKFSSVSTSIYKVLHPHMQCDNAGQYPLTRDMGSVVFPHLPLTSPSDPKSSAHVREMYGYNDHIQAGLFLRFILGSDNIIYIIDHEINKVDLLQPGWSITVDFSQGKEYQNVALVLPKVSTEVVPRSMVDTTFAKFERSHIHVTISRAKKKFILFGDAEAMQEIASRNGDRLSSRFTLLGPLLKYLRYSLLLEKTFRVKK